MAGVKPPGSSTFDSSTLTQHVFAEKYMVWSKQLHRAGGTGLQAPSAKAIPAHNSRLKSHIETRREPSLILRTVLQVGGCALTHLKSYLGITCGL